MLRTYFDDSGTHEGSPVVVWGGVLGTEKQFDALEAAWDKMLAEPVPGKPPLQKFSVGDCRWAENEFENYKPPERDMLRHRTRAIIRDSGVVCIAYAIPSALYYSIIRGRALRAYGPPSGIAFASCADYAMQMCEGVGQALACYFDIGQQKLDPTLDLFISDAEQRAEAKGIRISYGFAPVLGTYGLQAADTVATEHYWYALDCLDDPQPVPKPHFLSLVNMTEPVGWSLSETELRKMRDDYYRMYPIRKWLMGHRT